MQHIDLCPVKGLYTTAPDSVHSPSMSYPVTLLSFETDTTNPTTWRKVYSDGWIEMGGYVAPSSIAGYETSEVAFPANWAFPHKIFFIECQPLCSGITGGDTALYGVMTGFTTTGFTYRRASGTTATVGFYWIAKGL